MQIQFYHLTTTPLERALPKLLEKAYGAGLRVHLAVADEERADYFNQLLWTYDQDSFLPHGTAKDGVPELQPVFIAADLNVANNASALFITEGSDIPEGASFERVFDLFDGNSADAVERARARWKRYKDRGGNLAYFKQNERGGWEKAA